VGGGMVVYDERERSKDYPLPLNISSKIYSQKPKNMPPIYACLSNQEKKTRTGSKAIKE